MITINYIDLLSAFDFVSAGHPFENAAYISTETGEIYWDSESVDLDDELPEDLGESDCYIQIPHKNDLDLGRKLALSFAEEKLSNDDYERVFNFFRKRGAYARFKDLLESRDMLQAWFQFEERAVRSALEEWAKAHGFQLSFEIPEI